MQGIDSSITQSINAMSGHNAALDSLMMHVTAWGVPLLVLTVAAQWWTGTDRQANRHVLLAAGFSFGLSLAFNQIILLFVHRMRPYDAGLTRLLVERSTDPSFPSDHATASVAIAAAFLVHGALTRGAATAIVATVICFSRVYVGTHYISDVVGGAATGVLAAFAVMVLYRPNTKFDVALTNIL